MELLVVRTDEGGWNLYLMVAINKAKSLITNNTVHGKEATILSN